MSQTSLKDNKKYQNYKKSKEDHSEKDLLIEQTYALWRIQYAAEKTRSNTSTLLAIVVIGIVLSILLAFVG